jgi:hypothetical protein
MVIYEQRFGEDNVIEYSPITSCMSVTLVLPAQRLMGVHFTVAFARNNEGIIAQMQARIAPRAIQDMYIAGPFQYWGTVPGFAQFETQNIVQTFMARFPVTGSVFMLDLAGAGNRPRFQYPIGAALQVHDVKTMADITASFIEM